MKQSAIVILSVLLLQVGFAQQTRFFSDEEARLKQAKDYYQQEQYTLAYPLFKELQQSLRSAARSNESISFQEVNYYATVCALKQNEATAEVAAQEFIDLEPNIPRRQMMNFHLAEYYFRQNRVNDALPLYEQANIANLSNREIADMKFHQGYGYFTRQQFNQAKPLLDVIRQMPKDPNYLDANYYYGFILYYEKKYNDALTSFRLVENHPEYGKVVPFYITQILYFRGQKDEALRYGEELLKRGNQFYDLEMRQLIGHAYFEKKEFGKALPYLEQYVNGSDKVRREDLYELSYCYYQANQMGKAIEGFKQLSGKEDSLSQNSMYLLGDAYLKRGEKANARNAFLFCALNNSNDVQREVSRFNYAKLSFELGYQDVAITEFQKFLEDYPQSTYNREARELLVNVLANTNNYKDALVLMEGLDNPSENTKKLLPKILYGRATELINDQQLDEADVLLAKVLVHPSNASVLPYANYWKGEIAYRQNRIDDAIRFYNAYLSAGNNISGEVNPKNAKYNLGYCLLKKENYRQALGYFEQVNKTAVMSASEIDQDAFIRAADCYYVSRDYAKAKVMYDAVISNSWPASDYAIFQKAMIAGISNAGEKIKILQTIEKRYPASNLAVDANMEIANTLVADEKYREAIPYLNNVVSSVNGVSLKPQAYLKLGIAYTNLNNNNEALKQFRLLVKDYPNSPEAEDALDNVREIYVEEGRASEYADFMRNAGKPIAISTEDSLTYISAERKYMNGEYDNALVSFGTYLGRFPQGVYMMEANFYTAEIYARKKEYLKALPGYEAVANKVPNKFAEKSLLEAGRINYFDVKDYAKSEQYFSQLVNNAKTQEYKLEGQRGLLRSQYQQQKWTDATPNAQNLLQQKGISSDDKVLANLVIARSKQSNNEFDQAIPFYRTVVSLNKAAFGAEARYEIANCLYQLNKNTEAEKAAFEVINKAGSYDYWVTKAYILLGDLYLKQKDYFNAKATFQSIVDNSKIEDLRAEAQRKLNQVIEEEKKNSKIDG